MKKSTTESAPVAWQPWVPAPQRTPLTIYVAWHTHSEDGEYLASRIFSWFRGDPRDLEACGTGIPVHFRAWHPGASFKWPLSVPKDGPGMRILVLMVDEHFVSCKEWRSYVHFNVGIAKQKTGEDAPPKDMIVLPVALHPGAFQLSGAVKSLNFLRPDGADHVPGELIERRRGRRSERIRNQLTDAIGRLLVAKNKGFRLDQFGKPPEKVSVFLSHAKADGGGIASTLRDEVQRRGQLDAFFDESDLAFGFEYASELDDSASNDAVMIAVLTDTYSSRPWCRHELRSMRAVRLLATTKGRQAQICKLSPVLVVEALEQQSIDHLPEVGPAPVVRWRPEAAGLIVDTAQRLVLQYAHDLQRAMRIAERLQTPDAAWTFIVNGPPDLRVVAEVRRLLQLRMSTDAGREHREGSMPWGTLVFPGPGVTTDTLDDWQRLFPELAFCSFDDMEIGACHS